MSLWLDADELKILTGFAQRKRQIEALAQMRPPIKFRVRDHDSFPLVDRSQFEGKGDGNRMARAFARATRLHSTAGCQIRPIRCASAMIRRWPMCLSATGARSFRHCSRGRRKTICGTWTSWKTSSVRASRMTSSRKTWGDSWMSRKARYTPTVTSQFS